MEQFSRQKYLLLLMSNDINESFMRTLNKVKADLNEFKITNRCSLSKEFIKIPIRHTDLEFLGCIFDLENFLDYAESKPEINMEKPFQCPGCQKQTNLKGYGVDRNHYNFLVLLNHYLERLSEQEKNKIQQDFVYLQIINNEQYYFVKNLNNDTKIRVPGTTPILGITKRIQYQQQNQNFTQQQKRIRDQLSANITILQNYKQKLYLKHKLNNQNREEIEQSIKDKISNEFKNSIKLQVMTQQSIQQDFVFLFVKTRKNQYSQNCEYETYLLVYYVYYNVWKQFLIEFNNQQLKILQQSLYIKQNGKYENYIYIIGGKYQDQYNTSNQVYKITIPNVPTEDNQQATVQKLTDIPQPGYHYLGTEYNGKIYIFYGQQVEVTEEGDIESNLLNRGYAFYDNKWTDLKLTLEPRFDGSFFTHTDGNNQKYIVFFGGLSTNPDGVANKLAPQQHKVQIFNFQTEKLQLFGQGNKNLFQLNFSEFMQPKYVNVLCLPVISFPHYNGNQLIVSGVNYQEDQVNDHAQIYSFQLQAENMKLNYLFSLTPPDNNFTLVKKQNYEYFSPVQDNDGCQAQGNYYTLSHYYDKNLPVIKLLRINLAFGQIQYINQQDSKKGIENFKDKYLTLPREENQIIQTNPIFKQSQN